MLHASIKKRLTISLLFTILLVSGITIHLSYRDSVHEINEVFDAQLAQSARIFLAQLLIEQKQYNTLDLQQLINYRSKLTLSSHEKYIADLTQHEYERKIGLQLWDKKKKLLFHSQSVGQLPLSSRALSAGISGFSDLKKDQQNWRVFSIWDKQNQFVLQVGESFDIRQELVENISRRLITPYLVSIPLLTIIIWYVITRALKPMNNISKQVRNRKPDNLSLLNTQGVPEEILPLVSNLNTLFTKLNIAFDKERQFTNDAAHELRTPLAALKTHTQVALKETDTGKIKESLLDILNGVKRASHIIDQMLTLARLTPAELKEINKDSVELLKETEQVAADLSQEAVKKNVELVLEGDREIRILSIATLVSILLRNLIHNAIHYTPEGGKVMINVSQLTNGANITITDTGPGIEAQELERVFDRFYRILGHREDGCGLGLSIARQCAEHLNAELHLENHKPNGLVASITFYDNEPENN